MQQDIDELDIIKYESDKLKMPISSDISLYAVSLYYKYKNQEKNIISYPEDMIIKSLGYDSNDIAFPIFRDLILYTVKELEEHGIRETKKLIKNPNSYIYVELANFEYEIGLCNLKSELERLHTTRNVNNINIEVYDIIFGKNYECNVYDSVISIARYIEKSKQQCELNTNHQIQKNIKVKKPNETLALA